MVEASNWELQPQETPGTPGVFMFGQPTSPMVEAVERHYETLAKPLTDHVAYFMKFRQLLSVKCLTLAREADEIKDFFREAANKREGLGNFQVFEKGEKHYLDLLDMNIPLVIQGVENDLDRAKQELRKLDKEKEFKIQQLIELFERTISSSLPSAARVELSAEELEQAIATMRKLSVYGYTQGGAYVQDYEWPTADDLRQMPRDKPFKVAALNWKKCDQINTVIGGIQMVLTNGQISPLYLTKESSDKNLERLDVDFAKVRRLRGTSNQYWVSQLHFLDGAGQELAKIQSYAQQFGADLDLAEGEEIIGIYGTRNAHNQYFATIGFIVWRPPRLVESVSRFEFGQVEKGPRMICKTPRHPVREDCKAVPSLDYLKLIKPEEAFKIHLKEVQFHDQDPWGLYTFSATMSDGQQLGYVRPDMARRVALPRELKKVEVFFQNNEKYLYNIKFHARDGREISLRQGGENGPGRVETLEFAPNEHLLSCELDYQWPGHGCTDIVGVTWIKWVRK